MQHRLCSVDSLGADLALWFRHGQVMLRLLWCRHFQMQLRPLQCRHVQMSTGLSNVDSSWCSSCPCGVWCRHVQVQLRLQFSRRVQVQHRPRGVHVQVQLRHLWYGQVRCGVSS
jgi:hypothetical protein